MIVRVAVIFRVFENRIERPHAITGEEANVSYHSCNTPSSEGSSREPDENDIVPWHIVRDNKTVNLSDVLRAISGK